MTFQFIWWIGLAMAVSISFIFTFEVLYSGIEVGEGFLIGTTQKMDSLMRFHKDKSAHEHPKFGHLPMKKIIREVFDIGVDDPEMLVKILDEKDIFGLEYVSDEKMVKSCPWESQELIGQLYSTPNFQPSERFKEGDSDVFVIFQHLRKAGGTGFCEIAKKQLTKSQIPPYFCMIDNKGSLLTPPWNSQSHIVTQMKKKGFKITSNEWDRFPHYLIASQQEEEKRNEQNEQKEQNVDFVFGTCMRHPLQRWYSQYVFEHLEARDQANPSAHRTIIPFPTFF